MVPFIPLHFLCTHFWHHMAILQPSVLPSATSFSCLTGNVLFPCNILLRRQLLYNLPLTINDISILVNNGNNCLNLLYPVQILVSTAASASPSTLIMSPKSQNVSSKSIFALTLSTLVHPDWLLDSCNLYKQMSSSLCVVTCHVTSVNNNSNRNPVITE